MIAVIFEVLPRKDAAPRYFEIAAALKPMLESIDGFVSVERFESLSTKRKYLSLSFWRDEDAVRAWRTHALHRGGQQEGRSAVFEDYRLRVAGIVRDYGMFDRAQAPADSLAYLI
jgi:heme-degrading monooxygenase HmoA